MVRTNEPARRSQTGRISCIYPPPPQYQPPGTAEPRILRSRRAAARRSSNATARMVESGRVPRTSNKDTPGISKPTHYSVSKRGKPGRQAKLKAYQNRCDTSRQLCDDTVQRISAWSDGSGRLKRAITSRDVPSSCPSAAVVQIDSKAVTPTCAPETVPAVITAVAPEPDDKSGQPKERDQGLQLFFSHKLAQIFTIMAETQSMGFLQQLQSAEARTIAAAIPKAITRLPSLTLTLAQAAGAEATYAWTIRALLAWAAFADPRILFDRDPCKPPANTFQSQFHTAPGLARVHALHEILDDRLLLCARALWRSTNYTTVFDEFLPVIVGLTFEERTYNPVFCVAHTRIRRRYHRIFPRSYAFMRDASALARRAALDRVASVLPPELTAMVEAFVEEDMLAPKSEPVLWFSRGRYCGGGEQGCGCSDRLGADVTAKALDLRYAPWPFIDFEGVVEAVSAVQSDHGGDPGALDKVTQGRSTIIDNPTDDTTPPHLPKCCHPTTTPTKRKTRRNSKSKTKRTPQPPMSPHEKQKTLTCPRQTRVRWSIGTRAFEVIHTGGTHRAPELFVCRLGIKCRGHHGLGEEMVEKVPFLRGGRLERRLGGRRVGGRG